MNRQAAVAGLFYPEDAQQLASMITSLMTHDDEPAPHRSIKAMIVPHAGYIYSGDTAAKAYQHLKQQAASIKRVVLLGPSHRVGFYGLAVPSYSAFETPLGSVSVDKQGTDLLVNAGLAKYFNEAHQLEHSIEVQLPFLQTFLPDYTIVPIVVGNCDAQDVCHAINALWDDDATLFVISSDLSHYLSYEEAVSLDNKTADAIEHFEWDNITPQQACGALPISGLLLSAQQHDLTIERLVLCNSGDSAGSKDKVVGYASYIFQRHNDN